MDDDVMDQQKFASAAMVLAKHLVEMEKAEAEDKLAHPEKYEQCDDHELPELPLYKARQVMTRADFIQKYDHDNLFTIDIFANVRADSVPMMNAFREIVAEEGFDEYLEATLERIGDIESLGRTRELTIKVRNAVGSAARVVANLIFRTSGMVESITSKSKTTKAIPKRPSSLTLLSATGRPRRSGRRRRK